MYAWDLAPGLRRPFALDKLLISDKVIEKQVREEFIGKADFSRRVRIAGSDADPRAIANAKANLERIRAPLRGTPTLPEFRVLPMEQASAPRYEGDDDTGFIITNPPYGKRLGDAESSEKVYAEMNGLAERFSNWKLALITDHPGFESFFSKKADSCRDITNGAIHSYLYQYEKL
jgi:putative N6-adenine-specific DNA methylase